MGIFSDFYNGFRRGYKEEPSLGSTIVLSIFVVIVIVLYLIERYTGIPALSWTGNFVLELGDKLISFLLSLVS